MFMCGMVLQCAGMLKPWVDSGPVTADLTTTIIHIFSYKLLIIEVKPRSLTFQREREREKKNKLEMKYDIASY